MNADVTGWERLLIRWYYVMGPLPRRGFTCILIVMGEFLFLSMLDDLVFHNTELYLVGLFTAIAIAIVFTASSTTTTSARRRSSTAPRWHATSSPTRRTSGTSTPRRTCGFASSPLTDEPTSFRTT